MKKSGNPEGPVNQRAPSGPETMSSGWDDAFGTTNSVILPLASRRPIWAASSWDSVNQMLPSDPRVMCRGWLLFVGTMKDLKWPTGVANSGGALCRRPVGEVARSHATAVSATANTMRRLLCFMLDLPQRISLI